MHAIFICDKYTIRHTWQSDSDFDSETGAGTVSIIFQSTAAYTTSFDAHRWGTGLHGEGFNQDPDNLGIIRNFEKQSELSNSPSDWKVHRRWRNSIKAKDLDDKLIKARDQSEVDAWDKSPSLNWASASMPKRPGTVVLADKTLNKTEKLMRDVR